ncbi:glycerophosphodiester phosphodiesterase family protein [Streptococcus mutans]|uniref:glycerophosphodiester phosphodiesterase family protein n=1 Tax=Streptococcus mutans TaxID=1309 RepID=UPI0004665BF8|nr:glycerophosphodiester phosphodiesterase family protein [Streptococcus mutans]
MKIKRYFPPKRQVYSLLKMLFLQITVDQNFMTKLLTNHKKIYAWTVNNESVMTGMILMGVNGIITDYLTTSQGGNQR